MTNVRLNEFREPLRRSFWYSHYARGGVSAPCNIAMLRKDLMGSCSFLGSPSPRILRSHGLQGSSFWRFCLEKAPTQGAHCPEKIE